MQEPHLPSPISLISPPQHSVGFSEVLRDGTQEPKDTSESRRGLGSGWAGVERRGWEAAEQLECWPRGSGKTWASPGVRDDQSSGRRQRTVGWGWGRGRYQNLFFLIPALDIFRAMKSPLPSLRCEFLQSEGLEFLAQRGARGCSRAARRPHRRHSQGLGPSSKGAMCVAA